MHAMSDRGYVRQLCQHICRNEPARKQLHSGVLWAMRVARVLSHVIKAVAREFSASYASTIDVFALK